MTKSSAGSVRDFSLKHSRITLLIEFLVHAERETFLPTDNPSRDFASSEARTRYRRIIGCSICFLPSRKTREKSSLLASRSLLLNFLSVRTFVSFTRKRKKYNQAAKRTLPRLRRAFIIRLPLLVFMRALNPCFLDRFLVPG